MVVVENISERKDLERRLRQAQRMESIGNLAGGIAHDFNNILTPIVGISEMLSEDLASGSIERENAMEILKAGLRGKELVNRILAFSRQSEPRMVAVPIQQILKEALKFGRATIPSNFEISQNIQNDCGLVLADPTQIHQIIMNLLTNAYHAVEQTNGKIDVELKEEELSQDRLSDSILAPGRYVVLRISDTGTGMEVDIVNRIFEPYFTTKELGKGTGLGLAVVYGILREHKGDIKVCSEPGKGSTFTVYLPMIENATDQSTIPKNEILKTGNERILVVDDEETIARLEVKILERFGYTVTTVTSSVRALDIFSENPEAFDLVITDMAMPQMTGDKLAEKILSIKPDIPIIICTGFSEMIDKDKAAKLGIKGFLMKPVVKSEIIYMVRQVLDEAKGFSVP